ncbi:MAG: CoA transferase [Burkholderiales bacterium]|nr:CoA transferase [Burkholderiales bacterium]
MAPPLAGVRVVEYGADLALAYAGRLLAELGADVTRVVPAAVAGVSAAGSEVFAAYLHAGKRNEDIDPASDAIPAGLHQLLNQATIVLYGGIEQPSAAPDVPVMRYCEGCPDLIAVSVSPFGRNGAASAWPADDLVLQAIGGISLGIGSPARAPLKLPGDQSAFQAGVCATIAALAALHAGRGTVIDLSAADVWASFYSGVDVALAHFGRSRKQRAGQRVRGQPYPRTIFRCKDGYFAVQCGESRHWQAFLAMIGKSELAADPLFANRFQANDLHADRCDALIEPWFLERSKAQVLESCLTHKIPGAPVYDIGEVAVHPHLRQRGYFVPGVVAMPTHVFSGLAPGCSDSAMTQGEEASSAPPPIRSIPGKQRDSARRVPLEGIRVVDFGWVWAGAVPGHILADLGAEVIKVESASPLDYMRQGRPIVGKAKDPEQNPMFQNVNRGKLSLRIKLDHPGARAVLLDLVARSDVVIENFSPGVMAKFGLDYGAIARARPDAVMCSMSAVGQHGPLSGIRTYATMIASLAGLDSLVAYPGERVLGSQSSYADPNASLHATVAILAALWRRRQTREGAYLDLSQWEAAVNVMSAHLAEYVAHGAIATPSGARHPTKAPHGNFPAAGADRWIAISVWNDSQWQALRRALGGPAWMAERSYASASSRLANVAQLEAALGAETAKHCAEDLAAQLRAAGVAAMALHGAEAIARHALFRARELFQMLEHPVLGALPLYRLPWHVDGAPVPIARRAPLLGEHNAYVLETVLGYSKQRTDALATAGLFT